MSLIAVLAKLQRSVDHYLGQIVVETGALDDVATADLLALMDASLVRDTGENAGSGYSVLEMTEYGDRVLREDPHAIAHALTSSSSCSSGDLALWEWLLLNGGVSTYYSGIVGMSADAWHLLACGIDLSRSTPVRDDTWYTFAGTFADYDDKETGVSAHATCVCGNVESLVLVAQVESVTELLRQVLS